MKKIIYIILVALAVIVGFIPFAIGFIFTFIKGSIKAGSNKAIELDDWMDNPQ